MLETELMENLGLSNHCPDVHYNKNSKIPGLLSMMGKRCDSKLLGDMGNFFPPAFILLTCELFRKQRKNRLYPCHNQVTSSYICSDSQYYHNAHTRTGYNSYNLLRHLA